MSNQSKFFKNNSRSNEQQYVPYVPQHKILDKEPVFMDMPAQSQSFIAKMGPKNKFTPQVIPKAPASNYPFAEPGNVHPKFPNIGNTSDMSWSSLNQKYVDENGNEFQIDSNQMIDNNDYIDLEKYSTSPSAFSDKKTNQLDEYLLYVDDVVVAMGNFSQIENEVRAIIFDEHEKFSGISSDRLSVFKKLNIQIGVFIKE